MAKETSNNASDTPDLDIVDVFNACLPFEKHLPGMNYCGPGTNLLKKLNDDGKTLKKGYEPVDRVGEAALKHDIKNSQHDDHLLLKLFKMVTKGKMLNDKVIVWIDQIKITRF